MNVTSTRTMESLNVGLNREGPVVRHDDTLGALEIVLVLTVHLFVAISVSLL